MATIAQDRRHQYTAAAMSRAREHFEAGWKPRQIPDLLEREGHGRPSLNTVHRWVYPGYRDRHLGAQRMRAARATVQKATFRLSSTSPEYQLAFIERLRREGIPCSSIAKCCRVVLGTDLSREQVRDLLKPRS